jgi:hypothetical protein
MHSATNNIYILIASGLLGDRQVAPGGGHHVGDEGMPQVQQLLPQGLLG